MNEPDTLALRPGGCVVVPAADDDGTPPLPVPEGLRCAAGAPAHRSLTLFDTWPWDLWHAGRALLGDGDQLHIIDRRDPRSPLVTVPGAAPPAFHWEQPAALAALTAGPQDLRAVLPQATLPVAQRWWAVRNEDDKIVLRLLEQRWGHDTRTVQLVPLRGYGEEADAVLAGVYKRWRSRESPLHHALLAAGLRPRAWSSKPSFDLAPKARSRAVAVDMLRTLIARATETEAGIVADHDTEFLHDYRVLLRRARSVLSVMKGVFSPEATASLKERFRALANETNQLRDLDVHLLARAAQEARVPAWMRPGLAALFDDLQAQRDAEQARLARMLQRAAYHEQVSTLDAAVAAGAPGPTADVRIDRLAHKRVHRAVTTVLHAGRAIHPETADEAVHELRIDCKKLRYTLELFAPLYDADTVSALVKRLKKLQDVLGAFNDLSVQQDALRAWATTRRRLPRDTALAVGALIGALDREQREVRSRVEEAFAAFDHGKLPAAVEAMTGRAVKGTA